ncbi:hypothetical protein V8E54_004691 [Elaphomyces granulatus]|jgi:predicted heme/steroid binding protein
MSQLRQRTIHPGPSSSSPSSSPSSESESGDFDITTFAESKKNTHQESATIYDEESNGITLADIIRVLVTLTVALCGLSYYMTLSESWFWGYRPWFTKLPVVMRYLRGPLYLTPEQLSLYNGTDSSLPLYVAVNGTIFDVSANRGIYGPGGSYNFFAGRDATRAFVTGCFQEDLTPDLDGVEEMFIPVDDVDVADSSENLTSREKKLRLEQEVRAAKAQVRKKVQHWHDFFHSHKKYFEVGKIFGVPPKAPDQPKRELCEAAKRSRPKRGKATNEGNH